MASAPGRRGDGARDRIVRITAEAAALTATPARIIRVEDGPRGPRAIHHTSPVARAEPAIAVAGTRPSADAGSAAKAAVAAAAPPPEMPSRNGSARGFDSRAWRAAPARARAAPTSSPRASLGRRSPRTMVRASGEPFPARAASASRAERAGPPASRAAAAAASSTAIRTTSAARLIGAALAVAVSS